MEIVLKLIYRFDTIPNKVRAVFFFFSFFFWQKIQSKVPPRFLNLIPGNILTLFTKTWRTGRGVGKFKGKKINYLWARLGLKLWWVISRNSTPALILCAILSHEEWGRGHYGNSWRRDVRGTERHSKVTRSQESMANSPAPHLSWQKIQWIRGCNLQAENISDKL